MIQDFKTSGIIVAALAKVSGHTKEKVAGCLKYNILTSQQASFVTGLSVYSIEGKLRESKLTAVYPFPAFLVGPKFILRDEKFNDFISNQILKAND